MATRDGGHRRWRDCGRKTRFASEDIANFQGKVRGLRAYLCSYCDGYHLTHQIAVGKPGLSFPPRQNSTLTPLQIAERKLDDAEKILAHFQAMVRAHKQLPPRALPDAQVAVENARRERDAVRDGGRER